MLKPMFGHRPKPKKFDYPFRYYDPEKEERKRRRVKIERLHTKYHHGRSVLLYALGLAVVVYIISIL
jgi:hypothetical protein